MHTHPDCAQGCTHVKPFLSCFFALFSGALDLCYDSEIRSVAQAIVDQGLDKLGYQYINMCV
eukprot:m.203834 g.203834  ORF g.203834 m.203834 type:complete len:62 (-) comp26011_c0_seq4:83-268(-)